MNHETIKAAGWRGWFQRPLREWIYISIALVFAAIAGVLLAPFGFCLYLWYLIETGQFID